MYRILIVEDDSTIASNVASHLERWDYEIKQIEDFKCVLEEFQQFDPQLVILDIGLPFYNGFYWCQEIRKISSVPILFLSSMNDNMNIVMAMNMGGDEFIEKPFDLNVLTAKVQALLYLRVEDISSDLSFKKHAVDDMVRQVIRKYSKIFISKKIKMNFKPTERYVVTDEKWFVFVLEQLISNALKYTKQGQISIYMEDKSLVIADTGIGIPAEDLPRIFEKGFTGYNGRENKKSTGIGLYLCKNIMDKLQWNITADSEVGAGTKIYLTKM